MKEEALNLNKQESMDQQPKLATENNIFLESKEIQDKIDTILSNRSFTFNKFYSPIEFEISFGGKPKELVNYFNKRGISIMEIANGSILLQENKDTLFKKNTQQTNENLMSPGPILTLMTFLQNKFGNLQFFTIDRVLDDKSKILTRDESTTEHLKSKLDFLVSNKMLGYNEKVGKYIVLKEWKNALNKKEI